MKRLRQLNEIEGDAYQLQSRQSSQNLGQINNPYSNESAHNLSQSNSVEQPARSGSLSKVQMKGNAGNYNNILSMKSGVQRNGSQNASRERNPHPVNEIYYAQSPPKAKPNPIPIAANVPQTYHDQTRQALDSRIILAQQTGNQLPFHLETLSSNESRYTSSPNFLARSKESFNPSQFTGGVNSSLQGGGTQVLGHGFQAASVSSSIAKDYSRAEVPAQTGYHGTQVINVPTLAGGSKNNYFESISYSASSDFGHHSLRSSIEQSNSARGYQHMADQIRLEQYQVKKYQNPLTILEESKEEDVSFNKTITDQSPIPVRRLVEGGLGIGASVVGMSTELNLTGTGAGLPGATREGGYVDNKSSIDDGTRSLLMQLKGFPALDSKEHSGTLGSYALRNTSILGGGLGGQMPQHKPNFNITGGSQNENFLRFMGTSTPQKSSTQQMNANRFGQMRDDELLQELGQASNQDPRASTQQQQQLLSSLQVSDELIAGGDGKLQESGRYGGDFNIIDELGSGRQDLQFTSDQKNTATISGSGEVRDSDLKLSHVANGQERRGQSHERSLEGQIANQLTQSHIGMDGRLESYPQNRNIQREGVNDPIRIDDNQFVTLNQVEGANFSPYYGGRQIDYSGRPSNLSQYQIGGAYQNYYGQHNQSYGYGNHTLGGGPFSDGQSSSNPASSMNTPHQNQFQSRTVSPYPFTRREISNLSHTSQKCQCCQAPIMVQHHMRPLSGLSQIETKDLNFFDKQAQEEQEVLTPKLESEVDQSTKMISNKDTEKISSYKAVLCLDCQTRMLGKENFTPIAPSDLKSSELTTSNLMNKQSQIRHFDEANINGSNLSSIHQQYAGSNNLQGSSLHPYSLQNPTASQFNQLKFSSSLLGQSELQSSYLTASNPLPNQGQQQYGNHQNYILEATSSQYSQNAISSNNQPLQAHNLQHSTGVFQYSTLTQNAQHNQIPGANLQALQINSLMGNSIQGESQMTNPTLQSSSLHYLSYLSQNIGSQLKQSDQNITEKFGVTSRDGYKMALKSFVNKQLERSALSGSQESGSIQYSRIFRERQTKRLFEQLQNLKTDYVKSYEELEQLHTNLLLGKVGSYNQSK